MGNSASSQGALQRTGVQKFGLQKKKKARSRILASRKITESFRHAFLEKGTDDKAKGTKKGRVYLVTIIGEGLGNSKDKNYYSGPALKGGTQLFNGVKAYCDHPDAIQEKTLPERSMRDVVGWYSDCFTDTDSSGKVRLRGKLHMFPDAKWLSDKIDVILTDPSAKNLFGISINAIGKTRPATIEGEQVNYVEEFQRVDSADVVTEPAARGKFDQMLESKRGRSRSGGRQVTTSVMRRTREAAALSPEKAKTIADALVSGYHSDNPDELKQAAFEAAQQLHAAASISGRGPGQVNEEQYSNINPSPGGQTEDASMSNKQHESRRSSRRVKTSSGNRPNFRKGKRRFQAAAGTGEDNENVEEPSPGDVESHLEARHGTREADVEDEEGRGDLGDQGDFGGGGKYRKVKASGHNRNRMQTREDEGFEGAEGMEDEGAEGAEGMEDEGMEGDEGMEDENVGQVPGGSPSMGQGGAAPAGGGAPGSSRGMSASEAGDSDSGSDSGSSDSDSDSLMDMDETEEAAEGTEGFEGEEQHAMSRPGVVAESRSRRGFSRGRRTHEAEASFSGGLGHAGHKALPKGADPERGYEDSDEDYGKSDDSTSGVGKSYKIKTSRFARNRQMRKIAKPIVREANRRIEALENMVHRLRESHSAQSEQIDTYRGKLRFIESQKSARRLLREAVRQEVLPEGMAEEMEPTLYGYSRDRQIREITRQARLLESAQEGVISRLSESVEGSGARGGAVSWRPAATDFSDLAEGLAGDGIPMKRSSRE
jgi:hypothetical protein